MIAPSDASANKHQQKTEATRRKLLLSARRVFARNGFEAARIEDIAKEAGHTRGAFYANFESKEDVFFALLEQQATEHIGKMQRLLEGCSTEEERLAALRSYYVGRLADRQWSMLMLEFKLYALRHSRLRPKLLKTHREIRASLTKTKIQRLLPSAATDKLKTPEPIRRALEATLHALVLEHAYDPSAITNQQASALLQQIFDALVQSSVCN